MLLYHTTSSVAADRILADGFRCSDVWVADVPIDDGVAEADCVLVIDIPMDAIGGYEVQVRLEKWDANERRWIDDTDRHRYRAFCIPATLVNQLGSVAK